MKSKILVLTIFLALVVGCYYLMAAVPTQPKVSIDAAVESDWNRYIEYTVDLDTAIYVDLNTGGIDTIKIIHIESLDTNNSGIYYPFEFWSIDTSNTDSSDFGATTEFLAIGLNKLVRDTLEYLLYNPSTTETVTVEILVIGTSTR